MANFLTRRAFLAQLAFGQPSAIATGADAGGNTLVVVFLRGGADTLNLLVPHGDDRYYAKRPTLAIPHPSRGGADAAVKVDDFYAFHPRLAPLLPAWREGRF